MGSAVVRRGVFKFRGKILGRNAYYAVTSTGVLIENRLHVVSDDETDAEIAWRLKCALDRADPKRHLQLVPATVIAAIDGPSPAHPIARAEPQACGQGLLLEHELRATIEGVQRTRAKLGITLTDTEHLTPGVAERLSSLLEQTA